MHPFFFRNKCSVQVVFKLIFDASVTFVTSPTDGHLSTLSQNWRPCRCIRRPMVIVITILHLYLLKNELEKPSLRPRLSRLMFNLDIPLYFHGNTVLIVVILVFRDARVMSKDSDFCFHLFLDMFSNRVTRFKPFPSEVFDINLDTHHALSVSLFRLPRSSKNRADFYKRSNSSNINGQNYTCSKFLFLKQYIRAFVFLWCKDAVTCIGDYRCIMFFFNPGPCNRCNLCFQIWMLARLREGSILMRIWRMQLVQVPRVESISWKRNAQILMQIVFKYLPITWVMKEWLDSTWFAELWFTQLWVFNPFLPNPCTVSVHGLPSSFVNCHVRHFEQFRTIWIKLALLKQLRNMAMHSVWLFLQAQKCILKWVSQNASLNACPQGLLILFIFLQGTILYNMYQGCHQGRRQQKFTSIKRFVEVICAMPIFVGG